MLIRPSGISGFHRIGTARALMKPVGISRTRGNRSQMKLVLVAPVALIPMLAKDKEPATRLNDAAAVFFEVMAAPDEGIPQEIFEHAHCIVIVPDKTNDQIVRNPVGVRLYAAMPAATLTRAREQAEAS